MLNKVILMGRLTADPELRQTPNNISTLTFTVAINRQYQKDRETQTDFISCVAWRQTAEFISRYFSKGKMIIVEGALRSRTYEDKNGSKHYVTEVQVDNVQFGESKNSGNNSSGDYSSGNTNFQTPKQQETSPQEDSASLAIGNLSEFEEILGDGQLPF
jgi:single-strand DNA-binding protein